MLAAALLAALLSTATAAPALADSATPLGGEPLAVYVGEHGQLQAFRSGSPSARAAKLSSEIAMKA